MARAGLTEAARDLVVVRAGEYLPFLDRDSADILIGLPELGDMAGPLGAIALAIAAAESV